jgi:hypothetical protein
MLGLLSTGLTLGIGLQVFRVVSLGDPSGRMFDDGVGKHEYLLCIILDCGSAC